MHYYQCDFVHNALIIPHPQLMEENIKFCAKLFREYTFIKHS